MLKITMTKDSQFKKSKTVYETVKTETKEISFEQYHNIINARSFFKALGGTETHIKGYTSNGYCVIKIISTSPDKENRSINNFRFN